MPTSDVVMEDNDLLIASQRANQGPRSTVDKGVTSRKQKGKKSL